MIIAVDGTAGSGKGTIARGLAEHYHLPHLETGLLYRKVGLEASLGPSENFDDLAVQAAERVDLSGLDNKELSRPKVALLAARVARDGRVRKLLTGFQREFANRGFGAVLDGRDIGTNVCPDADVKIYVDAEPSARALRRTEQILATGEASNFEDTLAQIVARDLSDKNNPAGAFYLAADAHLLDTTNLSIDAALRAAIGIVEAAMAGKSR